MVQANKQNLATVSLQVERWTYSFSLGAQQTRTLSRPIWSLTLLVSMTSNARSGGKPFAHRERPSPVHKVTFKQRRNRTKKNETNLTKSFAEFYQRRRRWQREVSLFWWINSWIFINLGSQMRSKTNECFWIEEYWFGFLQRVSPHNLGRWRVGRWWIECLSIWWTLNKILITVLTSIPGLAPPKYNRFKFKFRNSHDTTLSLIMASSEVQLIQPSKLN